MCLPAGYAKAYHAMGNRLASAGHRQGPAGLSALRPSVSALPPPSCVCVCICVCVCVCVWSGLLSGLFPDRVCSINAESLPSCLVTESLAPLYIYICTRFSLFILVLVSLSLYLYSHLFSSLNLWEFRNCPGLRSAFAAFIGRVCQQSGSQSASFWPPCPSPLLVPHALSHLSVFLCLHLCRASMRAGKRRAFLYFCMSRVHVCLHALHARRNRTHIHLKTHTRDV